MIDHRRRQGGPDGRRRAIGTFAVTVALLIAGLIPLPAGKAKAIRQGMGSPELSRADRDSGSGGYYEGLIGGGPEGGRNELSLRLMGKPPEWVRFQDAGVADVRKADFLQFTLKRNLDRNLFGRPFTTNVFGMRDRPYSREKPPGVYRIALLGSSIDMGWGVATDETYEGRLEGWLNAHAARRGLPRRFEVLNFAVAAYGPAQRLAAYRRKAAAFDPDLVLYSATMLDPRLLEIHLCGLVQNRADPLHDFLRTAIAGAHLDANDLRRDPYGDLLRKEAVKAKLKPGLWAAIDASVGRLAADCRSDGRALAALIVPRVGTADLPAARAEGVAHHKAIFDRHGIPAHDLSGTFDGRDPATLEIAAWDDHPNAEGHKLLFLSLARALVRDPALYRTVFAADPPPGDRPTAASPADDTSPLHHPAPPRLPRIEP